MAKSKLNELVGDIEDALDKATARFLFNTQGKLIKRAPVDSGRFASSWFIGKDQPDLSVAYERPKGAADVKRTKYTGPIKFEGVWYISNNLPYAERVSLDPKWAKGGDGGAAWFTTIVNNLDRDAKRTFTYYLKRTGQ